MAQRGRRVARGANNNDHNDEENNLAAQIAALLRDGDRRRSVKVPRFDGRSSVAKFLEVFEEVRDINRWDDRETALQLKLALDGSARECVTGDTFEEMSDSLRARYELTQDMALRELKHLRFDNRSNIHEFGERVRHLVDVGYPALDDDQRVEIAIREVLDAIGDKVLRREFKWRQAQNFADALQRIQEYFSDMRADSRLRQADFGSDQDLQQLKKTVSELSSEVLALKTGMQEILKAVTAKNNYNPRPNNGQDRSNGHTKDYSTYECRKCKKLGHLARSCPLNDNETKN